MPEPNPDEAAATAAAPGPAPLALATEHGIDGRHSGDYLRLMRLLERGVGFQLVVVTYTSRAYRQQLIDRIATTTPQAAVVTAPPEADAATLVDQLIALGSGHHPVHLVGIEPWLRQGGENAWQRLNRRREYLAQTLASTLILWVEPWVVAGFAAEAPDLWAWRSAVLDFCELPVDQEAIHLDQVFLGSAERAELEQRLAAIRDYLAQRQTLSASDAELLLESSRIEERLGRWNAALATANSARDTFAQMDHRQGVALAHGQIARIFLAQGNLDDALHIYREELSPVFKKLGELDSWAMVQVRIAEILRRRGEFKEALHLLQEEALPVFTRLGDLRGRSATQSKIADILLSKGDLNEPLRLLREELLPVFENLGDLHNQAITLSKIAGILRVRGELGEALDICREKTLPTFEKLGDEHSQAVILGLMADVLQSQGKQDEALTLQRKRLAIFEKLGDAYGLAATLYSRAELRLRRGDHQQGGLQDIYDDLHTAFVHFLKLGRPDGIGRVGRLLAPLADLLGYTDEAKTALNEAEAALQKLGETKALARVAALRQAILTKPGVEP